eukprot:3843224-Rhodomonas_salina.3
MFGIDFAGVPALKDRLRLPEEPMRLLVDLEVSHPILSMCIGVTILCVSTTLGRTHTIMPHRMSALAQA